MRTRSSACRLALLALAVALGACTTAASGPPGAGAPGSGAADLGCLLPSNCVDSLGDGEPMPLRYVGTAADGMARLQATLANFPEAKVVRAEPLALETIFTTPIGFRDQVDFRIDPRAQRIDFRSRSLFGLFDFGKNRSRMREFARRFAEQGPR